MSARTTRARLLAASTLALAAFALTACGSGEGVRDEGSSAATRSSARPGGHDQPRTTAGVTPDEDPSAASTPGENASAASTPGDDTSAASTTARPASTRTRHVACDAGNTRMKATVVSRPLNHLLLTVTNKGGRTCDLTGYPFVRFSEAQSVPPVAEETHPQAVVTLAPGESGYAGVLLSAADGSGVHGYTAKTLEVYFGTTGRSARPALPAKGVYIDEKLTVTYWQQDMDTALSY
ncbi:DUF4232 domain-containing protein [Streptomyces sp. NPDC007084]|uniref:DUF4232 domain-containing protein n=1 Tax=Streptomyces sp. NPDC007084 TaxID=3154313 RepID=UPI00345664AD